MAKKTAAKKTTAPQKKEEERTEEKQATPPEEEPRAARPTPDDEGEQGEVELCQLGGNADPHPARWKTTNKAASELAYCERHRPANHANLGLQKANEHLPEDEDGRLYRPARPEQDDNPGGRYPEGRQNAEKRDL